MGFVNEFNIAIIVMNILEKKSIQLRITECFCGQALRSMYFQQGNNRGRAHGSVSYTHLTLPTNREVYIYVVAESLKKK